jgi:ribokinase
MVKKVIVFGSCNLDMFFDIPSMDFFVSSGVGAEDALHFTTHKEAPGGKGANQAVAAAKAGAKVHYFGAVGNGAQDLLENFRKLGINTSGVAKTNFPTGVAVIFSKPDGHHKMVVSHGANLMANHKQVPDRLLNKNSILVFQAETDLKQNAALMARAKKKGAAIIFNVAPATKIEPRVLACVDYLILNRPEAEVIAESLGISVKNLPSFAQAMTRKFDLNCIITLGELGLIASLRGEEALLRIPSLPVKVVDTVGAGDAFVGAFVAALAAGVSLEVALRHGAVAGSLACTRLGAQSALPTAKEIAKHLSKLGGKTISKTRRLS